MTPTEVLQFFVDAFVVGICLGVIVMVVCEVRA